MLHLTSVTDTQPSAYKVVYNRLIEIARGVKGAATLRRQGVRMKLNAMYGAVEAFFGHHRDHGLPSKTGEHARYIILDTIGAMLRGYADGAVRKLALGATAIPATCTVFTSPYPRVTPSEAIIANAASIASTELSEGNRHARGHMAIQVLPGLIASAEQLNSTTKTVLEAFVLGYEVSARMALASKRHFRAYGHGIYAPAATAVAVGYLEGLEAHELVTLLKISGNLSQAPAFATHFEGATVRNLTAGIGGAIGSMVPTFYRAGIEGSDTAMEITLGETLGSQFSRTDFVENLGTRYLSDENYFKTFASGRHMHAATEGLANLIDENGFSHGDIASIRVSTYYPATTMNNVAPRNSLAAKTSIPYCLAAYAVLKHNSAEAFEEPALGDDRIRRLAERVQVIEDSHRTARGGWGAETASPQRSAYIEVETNSGQLLCSEVAQTRGDYDTPLTHQELKQKFMDLATPSLGEKRAAHLMSVLLHSDNDEPFITAMRAALLD